jgi:uncharacterized protein (TIGR04255 family)
MPTPQETILAEVLLEVRFSGAPDLSLIVGKMDSALHAKYPNFENLLVPDFPINNPSLDAIVKYRMFSEDRSKLYNLGKGVLSINTVNYTTFASFLREAKVVLGKYKEISGITTLSRIGLRYINKISVQNRNFEDLFRIGFNLPESLKSIETGFNFQTLGKNDTDILSTRLLTEQPFSKETLMLDFDYFCEQGINYDLDAIEEWMRRAKTTIAENFRNSLTERYCQSLTA